MEFQPSVPASSAADVPCSSVRVGVYASVATAAEIEDLALVDKSSISAVWSFSTFLFLSLSFLLAKRGSSI